MADTGGRVKVKKQEFDVGTLQGYATKAGQFAHSRGLERRGSVMKQHGDSLVVEKRDGSVQVLRSLPATQSARAGTVLKKR
jgi:hypothetical protein